MIQMNIVEFRPISVSKWHRPNVEGSAGRGTELGPVEGTIAIRAQEAGDGPSVTAVGNFWRRSDTFKLSISAVGEKAPSQSMPLVLGRLSR
mmetsp:Transcript_45228/g.175580  ORF Transcript_45228/g.175580 Transcript_45228/m.175580 type:complete len:91 (+) Transcript_45228:1829-2101(+)